MKVFQGKLSLRGLRAGDTMSEWNLNRRVLLPKKKRRAKN